MNEANKKTVEQDNHPINLLIARLLTGSIALRNPLPDDLAETAKLLNYDENARSAGAPEVYEEICRLAFKISPHRINALVIKELNDAVDSRVCDPRPWDEIAEEMGGEFSVMSEEEEAAMWVIIEDSWEEDKKLAAAIKGDDDFLRNWVESNFRNYCAYLGDLLSFAAEQGEIEAIRKLLKLYDERAKSCLPSEMRIANELTRKSAVQGALGMAARMNLAPRNGHESAVLLLVAEGASLAELPLDFWLCHYPQGGLAPEGVGEKLTELLVKNVPGYGVILREAIKQNQTGKAQRIVEQLELVDLERGRKKFILSDENITASVDFLNGLLLQKDRYGNFKMNRGGIQTILEVLACHTMTSKNTEISALIGLTAATASTNTSKIRAEFKNQDRTLDQVNAANVVRALMESKDGRIEKLLATIEEIGFDRESFTQFWEGLPEKMQNVRKPKKTSKAN
jgi:hypothetical protein